MDDLNQEACFISKIKFLFWDCKITSYNTKKRYYYVNRVLLCVVCCRCFNKSGVGNFLKWAENPKSNSVLQRTTN